MVAAATIQLVSVAAIAKGQGRPAAAAAAAAAEPLDYTLALHLTLNSLVSAGPQLPDALAAEVDLSLAQVRKLQRGGTFMLNVKPKASQLPPQNCTVGSTSCHQDLQWSGTLTVRAA